MARKRPKDSLRLREIRHEKGVDAETIADHLGMPTRRYYRYENGSTTLTLVLALRIARFLGVSVEDFVPAEEPEPAADAA